MHSRILISIPETKCLRSLREEDVDDVVNLRPYVHPSWHRFPESFTCMTAASARTEQYSPSNLMQVTRVYPLRNTVMNYRFRIWQKI